MSRAGPQAKRHSRESGNPGLEQQAASGNDMKQFCVYILCSKRNGTLYTGVTSNLIKRVYEHRNNLADGFTRKYDVHRLVWYEMHGTAETAIPREKQIKKWNRQWKSALLEKTNPDWDDLYDALVNGAGFPLSRE
jgi:putative endonuclease